jgi:DNA-binding PadR family transcriptional regulator
LHLLSEKPRHGYEIEEVIEERGMREWTAIGFSSIYYLLGKLEKGAGREEPLARSWLEEGERGPARKVYGITSGGMEALREGALAALREAEGDYRSLLLGLSNLTILERDGSLTALKTQRQSLSQRQTRVALRVEEQRPLPDFVEALFDYSLSMIQARLDWLDNFIDNVESGRFDWPNHE